MAKFAAYPLQVIDVSQILDTDSGSITRRPWPPAGLWVFAIGLVALLSDSLHLRQPRFVNLHLLFGAVLLAVVTHRLFRKSHAASDGSAPFYRYTRQLARQVYSLLYLMAAVRLCLYGIEAAEAGTRGGLFAYLARRGSLDDFHVYIIYGLVASCLIHASAMLTHDCPEPQLQR